jgi:hypothetical protein
MTVCSLARVHVPSQPNPDEHHVIPQAWQRFWTPHIAVSATRIVSDSGPDIWDARTVTVCPNHHRLVHQAIVAMMRAGTTEEPAEAFKAAFGSNRTTKVRQTAYLALTRWVDAAGSLNALRTAKLWGEQ